jgi:SAM-dependent methyltransferase
VAHDLWAAGDAYEAYVGRWSRRVAVAFIAWLAAPAGGRWLDVGCGTGALSTAVLAAAEPARVVGVDPSVGFLSTAAGRIDDPRVAFVAGDARALPVRAGDFDAVVSALSLNFVPDPARAAAEVARAVRPGGIAAAYVWDYAEGMAFMRHFWDVAGTLDRAVADLDEALRFALCRPEPLRRLWTEASLHAVEVRPIEIPTVFTDFDDYWSPFLGGQGPAPGYVMSLPDEGRTALREALREHLPTEPDGSIRLTARAWAVRGTA